MWFLMRVRSLTRQVRLVVAARSRRESHRVARRWADSRSGAVPRAPGHPAIPSPLVRWSTSRGVLILVLLAAITTDCAADFEEHDRIGVSVRDASGPRRG